MMMILNAVSLLEVEKPPKINSYEFSSFIGDKHYIPQQNTIFVSTNCYQNDTWSNTLELTDESTWLGFPRKDNLINGANTQEEIFTIESAKQLLDTPYNSGGARWDFTIYQIIFDTNSQELYLKATQEDLEWTCFNQILGQCSSSNDQE